MELEWANTTMKEEADEMDPTSNLVSNHPRNPADFDLNLPPVINSDEDDIFDNRERLGHKKRILHSSSNSEHNAHCKRLAIDPADVINKANTFLSQDYSLGAEFGSTTMPDGMHVVGLPSQFILRSSLHHSSDLASLSQCVSLKGNERGSLPVLNQQHKLSIPSINQHSTGQQIGVQEGGRAILSTSFQSLQNNNASITTGSSMSLVRRPRRSLQKPIKENNVQVQSENGNEVVEDRIVHGRSLMLQAGTRSSVPMVNRAAGLMYDQGRMMSSSTTLRQNAFHLAASHRAHVGDLFGDNNRDQLNHHKGRHNVVGGIISSVSESSNHDTHKINQNIQTTSNQLDGNVLSLGGRVKDGMDIRSLTSPLGASQGSPAVYGQPVPKFVGSSICNPASVSQAPTHGLSYSQPVPLVTGQTCSSNAVKAASTATGRAINAASAAVRRVVRATPGITRTSLAASGGSTSTARAASGARTSAARASSDANTSSVQAASTFSARTTRPPSHSSRLAQVSPIGSSGTPQENAMSNNALPQDVKVILTRTDEAKSSQILPAATDAQGLKRNSQRTRKVDNLGVQSYASSPSASTKSKQPVVAIAHKAQPNTGVHRLPSKPGNAGLASNPSYIVEPKSLPITAMEPKATLAATAVATSTKSSKQQQQRPPIVDHIKFEGPDLSSKPPLEPLGQRCELCRIDLAFSPTGYANHSNDPPVHAVLPCGHCFHDSCLEDVFGPMQPSQIPMCIHCLDSGDQRGS